MYTCSRMWSEIVEEQGTHLISLACLDIERLNSELPLLQMNLMRRKVCKAQSSNFEHSNDKEVLDHMKVPFEGMAIAVPFA